MSAISIQSLHKTYGNVPVLKGINLDIADGEFVVFVGRSGCGKSTLLRCIAGLETISDGVITIQGRDVTRTPPSKRGIAMVFQSYALYPHLTVRDNLGFSLALARQPKAQIAERVQRVAAILRIEDLLIAVPASSPAASGSASPSAAPSSANRKLSCSMSRSVIWTPTCGCRCGTS